IPSGSWASPAGWGARERVFVDPLFLGDAPQQGRELAAFGRAQRSAKIATAARRLRGVAQRLVALASEIQRVAAAIVGVAATFDQPTTFEVVDEEHHPVGVDAE